MSVLEERGRFWWNDQAIPDGQFAPQASVAGLLNIASDGGITIELDGLLSIPDQSLSGVMVQPEELQDKCIQGILRATDRRVLLVTISKAGARSSNRGFSSESFRATDCLVSNEPFPTAPPPSTFRSLQIGLAGYENWLRLGSITTSWSEEHITIEYNKPKPPVYKTDDGTLTFNFLSGCSFTPGKSDRVSMKESAWLVYSVNEPATLEGLRERFRLFEDLLILLTGSYYRLDWPFISLDGDVRVRWYFQRFAGDEPASPPKWYDCWTNFPELRDVFETIWSNWKSKREIFGSGFNLYLGTRRGVSLYIEHEFVNLVWGIEAFHRSKYSTAKSDAIEEKIKRIVAQISKSKDKVWVNRQLKYAHEPALEQRIVEVFKTLPIDLDEKGLRSFAKSCAKARNDISHFR
jgi:hypothetical protein